MMDAAAADLAEHIAFVLEGATVRAGLESDPARLQHARRLVEQLLDAA